MAESDEVALAGTVSPTKISTKSPVKESKPPGSPTKVILVDTAKPLEKKVIQKITMGTDPVRAAKRLERFGGSEKEAIEAKKTKRASRFGSGNGTALIPSTPEIEEKKKARAERFGKGTVDVEEKKKARSARFGATAN